MGTVILSDPRDEAPRRSTAKSALLRTAAIKFQNGTILDVAKIAGSTEYVSAMKTFTEDALRVRVGEESSQHIASTN
jgi:hypothetical protein